MFIIKSIIYLNILSFITAQNEYNDLIIAPLELVLRSNDTEGIYYCNSQLEINKQRNKLMASFDKPILASPSFQLKTEQANATAIRIRIKPNGYIGVNRIICYWSNSLAYGKTADLIIGENLGVIQLKEQCKAFDHRYVECIFLSSIIARGFQNGFRRVYKFSEPNPDSASYRPSPVLVNITDENEFVFHFEPRDRNVIPKKILMSVNMTLKRFGSTVYYFYIEPIHTTKVNYRIEDISTKEFTIYIDHNNTGTISQRLCSGHISQVGDQNVLITVQDITETTAQKIPINRLRPSTGYEICLRCFYEQTDQSFKEEKCDRIKTTTSPFGAWFSSLMIVLGVVVVVASVIGIILFRRIKCARHTKKSSVLQTSSRSSSIVTNSSDSQIIVLSDRMKNTPYSSDIQLPPIRYAPEPIEEEDPFILTGNIENIESSDQPHVQKYLPVNNLIERLTNKHIVSPDTIDLTNQENS